MSDDSATPFDENRWLKMKPKVLLWIMGIVGVSVASWAAIKFDVATVRRDVNEQGTQLEHMTIQLQTIERESAAAREAAITMKYQQDLINAKLDYLTGDRRGPRPATGTP